MLVDRRSTLTLGQVFGDARPAVTEWSWLHAEGRDGHPESLWEDGERLFFDYRTSAKRAIRMTASPYFPPKSCHCPTPPVVSNTNMR